MLGQPVLEFIFALSVGEGESHTVDLGGHRRAHGVQALDVLDMFVNHKLELIRKTMLCPCRATSARTGHQRHSEQIILMPLLTGDWL